MPFTLRLYAATNRIRHHTHGGYVTCRHCLRHAICCFMPRFSPLLLATISLRHCLLMLKIIATICHCASPPARAVSPAVAMPTRFTPRAGGAKSATPCLRYAVTPHAKRRSCLRRLRYVMLPRPLMSRSVAHYADAQHSSPFRALRHASVATFRAIIY